jgi:hypothetical protein
MEGDMDEAEREFRADLAAAEVAGIVRHEANSAWGLARVVGGAGDAAQAAGLHLRALSLRHEMGDRLGVVDSLVGLAQLVARDEPDGAARVLEAAGALRAASGATPTAREAADVAAARVAIEAAGGPGLLERASGAELDAAAAVATAAKLGAAVTDGERVRTRTARRRRPARR